MNKRLFISGNYFYGKNNGDNLNLIETIKTIAGFAFPLAYCNNFLFYKLLSLKKQNFSIILYEHIKIPEIPETRSIVIFSLIKAGLLVIFMILMMIQLCSTTM